MRTKVFNIQHCRDICIQKDGKQHPSFTFLELNWHNFSWILARDFDLLFCKLWFNYLKLQDGGFPLIPKGPQLGYGRTRINPTVGGRECFYRVIFRIVFSFETKMKHKVIWKRWYSWCQTLLTIWIILSFVRFVVFLPLSAKMLVINMKKLPDCYVMALELPPAFFFFLHSYLWIQEQRHECEKKWYKMLQAFLFHLECVFHDGSYFLVDRKIQDHSLRH